MADEHQLTKKREFLTRLLRIAQKNGSEVLEGNVHEALGLSYQVANKNEKATEHFKKHLNISKKIKDKKGERNAYDQLGYCYTSQNQYKAIEIQMYLNIAKQTGDKAAERSSIVNLGNYYLVLGQYDKAIEQFEMHLNIAKQIGDKAGEGTAIRNLGTCYHCLGQYDKAIEHHEMHMNIAKQIGDKAGEGSAIGNLGSCYRCLGQYDKAIEHHEKHLNIAKQIGDKTGEGYAIGNLGTCYNCLGQYGKAIEHFEITLKIAKQSGDKYSEGSAIGNIGTCYLSLGQNDKAMEHFKMHLNIAKQIGDKASEGSAIGNLGTCYLSLGLYDKAMKHYEMHLNIAKQIGDKAGEGSTTGNLGECYKCLGQYDKAIEHYEMHLSIAKQIGDRAGEGGAIGNLGICYRHLSQYDKAMEHFEMHLNIANQIGDKAGEGRAMGNLGTCYCCLGLYDKAMKHHEMHLNIAKQIGDKAGEGTAIGNLGLCYRCLGQYDKAMEHFEMHLNIVKQIGDKADEGKIIGNLGNCYNFLGQYDKAVEQFKMRLNIAKQIGDKAGEGSATGNIGTCYNYLGQYDKAIEHYKMHLNIVKQIGDKAGEGRVRGNLGTCYNYLGHYEKAIEHFEMHLNIAKQIRDIESEAISNQNLGSCYYMLGQYDKAEEFYRESLESFEKLFKNGPQQDQYKVSIRDTFITTYRLFVTTLLCKEKKQEALVVAEKGRSKALTELLVNALHPERPSNAPDAKDLQLDEIREVVKALEKTVIYFALLKHDICTWVIQRDGNSIEVLPQDLNCQFDVSISRLRDLLSLIEKATKLLNSSGVVKCEDRSLSFLYSDESKQTTSKREAKLPSAINPAEIPVAQQSSRCDRTPGSSSMDCKQAAKTRSPESKNREDKEESELNSVLKDLFQTLLSPARQFVEGSQVVVVPDGPLALVPFVALIDGDGHHVAETLQVRLVPSLATAKMVMERPEEPDIQSSPLIVGDPDVDRVQKGKETKYPIRLPFAKKEAERVGKILGVEPFTAERATKECFLQHVEHANLIHIASHADMDRGEILLAPSPGNASRKFEDVMLTITDLEHKRLRAKLVVLSCCHSGRGEVRAEGVIGIGRAFLGAGAGAVLVTLWAVDDEATMYFMTKFYQHLTHKKRANAALNEAIKAMTGMERFRHPRHWAPFVLIGEDVALFDEGGE